MSLYSSCSTCGNCGKNPKLIVVTDNYKKLVGGKKKRNVDLFRLI